MRIRPAALVLLPFLILHLAGCTATRQLSLPGGTGEDPERPDVRRGQKVTVHLVDRDRVYGLVLTVSPDSLVIGEGGNHGWEKTPIPADRIAGIEIEKATTFTKIMLVVVPVVLVTVGVIAALHNGPLLAGGSS